MGEVLVICMIDRLICINIVGKQCALGDLDIAEQIVTKVGLGITLSTSVYRYWYVFVQHLSINAFLVSRQSPYVVWNTPKEM